MAVVKQILTDSRWKTVIKSTINASAPNNSSGVTILDVSDLLGFVTGSICQLASIKWSVSVSTKLEWGGTGGTEVLHFDGNGSYGGSDGMPALRCTATAGGSKGDLVMDTSAACVGFLVITFHKVETTVGQGGGWSA